MELGPAEGGEVGAGGWVLAGGEGSVDFGGGGEKGGEGGSCDSARLQGVLNLSMELDPADGGEVGAGVCVWGGDSAFRRTWGAREVRWTSAPTFRMC